jgi:hypothetical protein
MARKNTSALPPLTPDFASAVVVRPDLRFERTLFLELRRANRKIEKLQQQIRELIQQKRDAQARARVRQLAAKLVPHHNESPSTQRSK